MSLEDTWNDPSLLASYQGQSSCSALEGIGEGPQDPLVHTCPTLPVTLPEPLWVSLVSAGPRPSLPG